MEDKKEEVRHPYDKLHNEMPPPFENFLPFVKVNDQELREKFISFLRELYNQTKESWFPSGCQTVQVIEEQAKKMKDNGKLRVCYLDPNESCNGGSFLF